MPRRNRPRRFFTQAGGYAHVELEQESLSKTLSALNLVDRKLGQQHLKDGVHRAGKVVLSNVRNFVPAGKTRLLSRSLGLAKRSYPRNRVFMSIVGQKVDRLGAQRAFPSKTRAIARRKNWGLSTGISGTGTVVPIHLVELATKPHRIPRGGTTLMAMIPRAVKTGSRAKQPTRPGTARDIVYMRHANHPGKPSRPFLERAALASARAVTRIIQASLLQGIRTLRKG